MFNCLLIVMLNALWCQVECVMRPCEEELAKKLRRNVLAMRLRTYLEETLHAERSI